MKTKCESYRQDIVLLAAACLEPDNRETTLEHLKICESCRTRFEELQKLVSAIHAPFSLEPASLNPGFYRRLRNGLRTRSAIVWKFAIPATATVIIALLTPFYWYHSNNALVHIDINHSQQTSEATLNSPEMSEETLIDRSNKILIHDPNSPTTNLQALKDLNN